MMAVEQRQAPDEAGDEEPNQDDEKRVIQRLTGILLVVVGTITAGAIARQSWETRKAAESAAKTYDAVVARERARLYFTPEELVRFCQKFYEREA